MDALAELLAAKEEFVHSRIEAGQEPTPAQLAGFLRETVTGISPLIRQVPVEVQSILKRGFNWIGWDVRTNRSIVPQPPTAAKVLQFLQRAQARVEHYQAGMAESVHPTDAELADLSAAATRLWQLDFQRLAPGVDYAIQLQSGKKPYQQGDAADLPLFAYVSEEALARPSWAAFIALLDNYEASVGQAETVTREERAEETAFLDQIFSFPCMRYCHRYLAAKHLVPASEPQFKALLKQIWFGLYRRVVENDSSGFEHVFVGEAKEGKIIGLHNWIQIYLEERKGNLNYLGYIKPKVRGAGYTRPDEAEQLVTIQFAWNDDVKPAGSSFIGVSPGFEMALYTMCFLAGEEHQTLQVGPYGVDLTCFKMHRKGKDYIGTSFPAAAENFTPVQAATKIQAAHRGREYRRDPQASRDKKAANNAANKIQSRYRGGKDRQRANNKRSAKQSQTQAAEAT